MMSEWWIRMNRAGRISLSSALGGRESLFLHRFITTQMKFLK